MARDMLAMITEEFRDLRASLPPARKKAASYLGMQWMTGADTLPDSMAMPIRRPYAQHPTVYRAVAAIASALSRMKVEVRTDDDAADVQTNHWLPALLHQPDVLRRSGQLEFATVVSYLLRGEAFWRLKDIRRGGSSQPLRPFEIQLITPLAMTDISPGGVLQGWRYAGPLGVETLSLEEVVFFRNENPYEPIRGLGPLQTAIIEWTGDFRAAQWNRNFFENSAIPPIVFRVADPKATPDVWPEKDRREFVESWVSKQGGPGKAGVPATVPAGVDIKELKFTQQEMAYFEGRRFSREQILSALGVPPAIMGILEYANYANMGPQKELFYTGAVFPLADYVESVLTVDVLKRFEPGLAAYFLRDAVMAEVMADTHGKKVQLAQQLWSMGIPFAEINDRLDLGFECDEYPWLNTGWLPFNVVLAEQAQETAEQGEPAGEVDDPNAVPTDTAPASADENPADAAAQDKAVRWPRAEKARAALWKGYEKKLTSLERKWIGAWRKFLLTLRDKVLARIEAKKAITRELGDDALPPLAEIQRDALALTDPVLKLSIQTGWETILGELDLEANFTWSDPGVAQVLAARTITIKGAAETVATKLRDKIAEGITDGDSPQELADSVRLLIREQYSGQAMTVARTESAGAFSNARLVAMQENGVHRHQWLTARDGKVRASHQAVDGEVVAMGESFDNGLTAPHQAGAAPGEVINCRCVDLPVIEDVSADPGE